VRELSEGCFIPITVGGGVRSLQDIDALLRAGADKVAICTHATETFLLVRLRPFGRQAIVVVVTCARRPGAERFDIAAAVQNACAYGRGEILLPVVHRDGTMEGYDLQADPRGIAGRERAGDRVGRLQRLRGHAARVPGRSGRLRGRRAVRLHRRDPARRGAVPEEQGMEVRL
jgi:cyclase